MDGMVVQIRDEYQGIIGSLVSLTVDLNLDCAIQNINQFIFCVVMELLMDRFGAVGDLRDHGD